MTANSSTTAPLYGLRVLDLTRILAGPAASQMLADLGADVVKIERPDRGDDTREWGPPYVCAGDGGARGDAAYFTSVNRGKRSVAVDLTSDAGQQLITRLSRRADVMIENHKVGGLKQYGLDYDTLSGGNPALIYCSITGFGQSGPYRNRPGYDFVIQGMSGLMSVTGQPESMPGDEPMRVGVAVSDLFAGMHAVIGILAALNRRTLSGKGDHIDISLLDSQVAMLVNQAGNYLNGHQVPGRIGNTHPNIVPYQVFAARDKPFILAVGNDAQFKKCCAITGMPRLADDPRYARNQDRVRHRAELVAVLGERFSQRVASDWLDELERAGIPAGPINSLDQVFDDPQVKFRNLQIEMPLTGGGKAKGLACPVRLKSYTPGYDKGPPALGEHTDEVLRDWLDTPGNDKAG